MISIGSRSKWNDEYQYNRNIQISTIKREP